MLLRWTRKTNNAAKGNSISATSLSIPCSRRVVASEESTTELERASKIVYPSTKMGSQTVSSSLFLHFGGYWGIIRRTCCWLGHHRRGTPDPWFSFSRPTSLHKPSAHGLNLCFFVTRNYWESFKILLGVLKEQDEFYEKCLWAEMLIIEMFHDVNLSIFDIHMKCQLLLLVSLFRCP